MRPEVLVYDEEGTQLGNMDELSSIFFRQFDFTSEMRDAQDDVTSFSAGVTFGADSAWPAFFLRA
jgi:hypothetical protein